MTTENHEMNNSQQFDGLEQILAARPLVRAPRNTVARVMAQITTMPQEIPLANFAPPKIAPIRYAPPTALPLPEIDDTVLRTNRRVNRIVFTSLWVSLSALFMYLLIWPAFSNFFLGGSNDMNIIARFISLWQGLTGTVSNVFVAIAPLLPSLLSGLVGLAIMLLIFGTQTRRLRLE